MERLASLFCIKVLSRFGEYFTVPPPSSHISTISFQSDENHYRTNFLLKISKESVPSLYACPFPDDFVIPLLKIQGESVTMPLLNLGLSCELRSPTLWGVKVALCGL